MTKREFIDKNGNTWNCGETPETGADIKQLHQSVVNNRGTKPNAPSK